MGSGFQGSGFRVQGLGFRVMGFGFQVEVTVKVVPEAISAITGETWFRF